MSWKFCPECGSKFAETHKFCANCGTKRDGGDPAPPRNLLADLMRQYGQQSGTLPAPKRNPDWTLVGQQRCAYEGLPPGIYHLYCGCSKCSPQCATSTYVVRGDEQVTYTAVMNS